MRKLLSIVLATGLAALAVFMTMRMPAVVLLHSAHLLPSGLDARFVMSAAQALMLALLLVSLRVSPGDLSPSNGGAAGGLGAVSWLVAATFLFSLLVGLALLLGNVDGEDGGHTTRMLSRWAAEFPLTGVAGRLFFAGLFAPMLEELLFRGLVIGYLLRSAPAWLALGVSTILFALGHQSWLLSAVMGVGYGLIYLRFRNLWLCILAHSAHNLLSSAGASLFGAWLADRGVSLALGYWTLPVQLAWFAVVLVCAAMFVRRVFGRIEGQPPFRLRQPVVPLGGATT